MEEFVRWFSPCFGLAMVIYWGSKYIRERNDEDPPNSINTKDSSTNVNNESTNNNVYDGKIAIEILFIFFIIWVAGIYAIPPGGE